MKIVKNRKGETIVETLVALMIIALVLMMLAGSIVSAAKVNKKTKDLNTELKLSSNYPNDYVTKTIEIIDNKNSRSFDVEVKLFESDDSNHYKFYKVKN